MGARRARGEGTVTRRGPGVYRLRAYVGRDSTGRPIQTSRTVHVRTDTEARRELRKFLAEVEAGRVATPGPRATVAILLETWLAHLERVGRAATTIQSYRVVAAKNLIPHLGHLQMAKISAFDLDGYYTGRLAAGYAPRTVRLHHSILSGALGQAVKWGWLARNPALSASPPPSPRGQKKIPEVEDVRRLVAAAGDDLELAAAVFLAAITGARRGELCGLRWDDVDWEGGTLRVERQRVPLKGGDCTMPLKHGDRRTVTLGRLGVEVLARYRTGIVARSERTGLAIDPDGWLLSWDGGHSPLKAGWLGGQVTALARRAGLPLTTHAFRRFAATQMIGGGVDVRTAAGRLGHTPEVLLRVYAGFLPSRDAAAAELLSGILDPAAASVVGDGGDIDC